MASENIFKQFEQSWTNELIQWQGQLEWYERHLEIYKPKVGIGLVKYAKNRIKRCKWNITRAINLRKKHGK